jgi:ureidoacrylate peracid hydrolase
LEHCARARGGCYTDYPVCEKNEWNGAFYKLKPQPGDVIVNKHRYNAFYQTDLDLILRAKGIRTLIMTGVATNVCVETTAREGFMRDYYIVFLRDCTATMSEELHNSALKNISLFFGDVVGFEDVIKCWENIKKS